MKYVEITQNVRVRKYEINQHEFVTYLRNAKRMAGLSNSSISCMLDIPITKVEHWFRYDECFCVPDEHYWQKIKQILKIKDDTYDKQITEFEIKPNLYEKANRLYYSDFCSPTLVSKSANQLMILIVEKLKNDND